MKKNNSIILTICFLLLSLCGCGIGHHIAEAEKLEKSGLFVDACVKYEKAYRSSPSDSRAPEALYRMALIYQKKLKLYTYSRRFFGELLEKYPKSAPWNDLARMGVFTSPDFFPLTDKSFWIEGDSDTGGKNMRAEWNCTEVSSGTYKIQRKVFAGGRLVTENGRFYKNDGTRLNESKTADFGQSSIILEYPFTKGRQWNTEKDSKESVFTIEEENVPIVVKAGEFPGCLKLKEINPSYPSSQKYIYYAPEVGWVLTTVAASGGEEHRNTELLSYKINP